MIDPVAAVAEYLKALRDARATGAASPEATHYAALAALLDAAGRTLKVRVRCVAQPRAGGADAPDFGLYTPEQFQEDDDREPIQGAPPARGVVEVKPWTDDLEATAGGAQVRKYWERHGLVLVTNYRVFEMVTTAPEEGPESAVSARKMRRGEPFVLAATPEAFLEMLAHPDRAAKEKGARLIDYLGRAMLERAPLIDPGDVAWLLASHAREARARVEERPEDKGLLALKRSLETVLGIEFVGERGARFFHATLVQTLFYGVFSAWVLWARDERNGRGQSGGFNWRLSGDLLRVPMVRELFHQLNEARRLKGLCLYETLEWSGDALNRVRLGAFFARFDSDHAIQYFYEPFLEAYDPALRKELGVWYTPPEIVRYQVERVDASLREDLGIEDGLADERVLVLDPCCGTGAYLLEVLRKIHELERDKWGDALVDAIVRKAACERVFGFELLPAPFVIAHLQLGMALKTIYRPEGGDDQRPGVFLTNALTGWEPPKSPKVDLPFPEFERERELADAVKRDKRILVVLGNPPYNGYAGVAVGEERSLSEAYRTTKHAPAPQGQGLNDLYVRFFRMAERRIVEMSGEGIVSFISNYSWLEGLSHTGMRERYLEVFDRIRIDCLNGDKYKTGKLTPDGKPDPSVFSTWINREGIQVGTAIAHMTRLPRPAPSTSKSNRKKDAAVQLKTAADVEFRHLWGKSKLATLGLEVMQGIAPKYKRLRPTMELGLPMVPTTVDRNYLRWPLLTALMPTSFPGVKTSRDEFLVDIDGDRLASRVRDYFDPRLSDEDLRRKHPSAMQGAKKAGDWHASRYDPAKARRALLDRGRPADTVPYMYRPFDLRWLYWEPETKLLDEKRTDYVPHVMPGNRWLASAQRNRRPGFYRPIVCGPLADHHVFESNCGMFPLKLKNGTDHASFFDEPGVKPNLSSRALEYLSRRKAPPESLFLHVVAITHSETYAKDNESALRQNWPRIPLPVKRKILEASSALGRRVADLLDSESPVPGVTQDRIDPRLSKLGVVRHIGGSKAKDGLDPAAGDFDLTAGWGHRGQGSVVMPAKGRIDRRVAPVGPSDASDAPDGPGSPDALAPGLGDEVLDIHLNGTACWSNVPSAVWDYSLGGYQVLKKWLSYREKSVLGRGLKLEEVQYFTDMVRRIAALILLAPELDANYEACKAETWAWPSDSGSTDGDSSEGGVAEGETEYGSDASMVVDVHGDEDGEDRVEADLEEDAE